ncbi:MAG: FixH family protein [Alphaproteobacteria bacterium]
MDSLFNPEKGTWVFLLFTAFFGIIIAVNSVFIYNALNSHSGVITENPYRKGLDYNETLEQAKTQPQLNEKASYKDGILRWNLRDKNNAPLSAHVTATLVRTVKDGHDFNVTLTQKNLGIYEAALDLPMKGQWSAQMKATWKTYQYQTRLTFITK